MDYDSEIIALNAETLAIQAVLSRVLRRVAWVDTRVAEAMRRGFDDAASHVEDVAFKLGKTASSGHTVKALAIVEDLRAATFGKNDKTGVLI